MKERKLKVQEKQFQVNITHRPKRRRVGIESADNSIHEDPAQNASEYGKSIIF